jgi:hypothetical protein
VQISIVEIKEDRDIPIKILEKLKYLFKNPKPSTALVPEDVNDGFPQI